MRIRHIKGAEGAVEKDALVIHNPADFKGRWHEDVFEKRAPLYLETGMGMGLFLRTLSRQNPDINFIGLEINTTVLYKALTRYRKEFTEVKEHGADAPEKGNLKFLRSDARFLGDYFDSGEVERIYLNFPDPWPKEKNAARRLTSPHFLALYGEILSPKGTLEFKTDDERLFDYSLDSFKKCGWAILTSCRDLHHDAVLFKDNVMTEYESKFAARGNPIFKLSAAKQLTQGLF